MTVVRKSNAFIVALPEKQPAKLYFNIQTDWKEADSDVEKTFLNSPIHEIATFLELFFIWMHFHDLDFTT